MTTPAKRTQNWLPGIFNDFFGNEWIAKSNASAPALNIVETEKEYIICVTDDGVGFTEGEYVDDGDTHVGIENIKKRLDMMINARLEIESKKGIGTKACIFIPKRRDETCIS